MEVDEAEFAAFYRLLWTYQLSWRARPFWQQIADPIADMAWSVRLARRKGVKTAAKAFSAMQFLRGGPFDYTFYRMQLAANPRHRFDPVRHYILFGATEGFDPAPGFDTAYYLAAYPDVAASNTNPFVHYLKFGAAESRRREPSRKVAHFLEAERAKVPTQQEALGMVAAVEASRVEEIEDRSQHEWRLRDRPDDVSQFSLYDYRPDDPVLEAANAGQSFFDRHGLLSSEPDWTAAVDEINRLDARTVGKRSAKVAVSIVIPVYGQLSYTLNCLHALLAHVSRFSFEIIVADDASPDGSYGYLEKVKAARCLRSEENKGFIDNCNAAAKTARGEFVVLLNNDTRICDGWLDALIESFVRFPDAGLVGSKLYYPDGSLQEAGGIVWRDGSAWNYGRGDDPNRPRYSYARKVDYISGAAIALRRKTWEDLHGFDTLFRPAYYEDTDLAFRVRGSGATVIMQPLSKVIHYEGKTSGTDLSQGVKAYQQLNAGKFQERWLDVLARHRPSGKDPWLERDRDAVRRVLIVDACNPTPGMDAGSVATLSLIREYQALGYLVSFVPEDNFLYQRESVSLLQAMGVCCHYAPFEISMLQLLRREGKLYDVVHLIRADVAFKTLDLVAEYAPQAKILYLNADLHYLRMQRQALVEGRQDLQAAAAEMKIKELSVIDRVDVTMVHSSFEKNVLAEEAPLASVVYTPLLEPVEDKAILFEDRNDIMFLGGYGHPPNVDAAIWLISEIWPQLATKVPAARLLIVGANPPPRLKAHESDRIIVTGTVEDLSPWFAKARVFVAPLRYGAGAKGKLLASLARGVPVVATPVAAEGMPFTDGENIVIAKDADEISREVLHLYGSSSRAWIERAEAGKNYVHLHHSFQAGLESLRQALYAAGGNQLS